MTEKKICNLSYTSGNNLNNIKTPVVNIEGKRMESKFVYVLKNLIRWKMLINRTYF